MSHPLLTRWSAPPWGLMTWLNCLPWVGLNLAFVSSIDSLIFWRNGKQFQQLVSEPWVTGSSLRSLGVEGSVGAKGEIVDSIVNTCLGTHDMA